MVLVLHGGRVRSQAPTRPWQLSVLRARLLARDLRAVFGADGVRVVRLRFAVRGWNGTDRSPVADARKALGELASQFPHTPVVIVGHSMGARTAVAVAAHASVTGVVALAPWLPDDEPATPMRDRRLTILHGTADAWTSPAASRAYVQRARRAGAIANFEAVQGGGHFMVRHLNRWRDRTVAALAAHLAAHLASDVDAHMDADVDAHIDVPIDVPRDVPAHAPDQRRPR